MEEKQCIQPILLCFLFIIYTTYKIKARHLPYTTTPLRKIIRGRVTLQNLQIGMIGHGKRIEKKERDKYKNREPSKETK